MADVAGGGGDDGRREVLRVGGGELVQLILEVLASAGVAGHRINDHEDDDIDVILKLPGLANDAPKNSVFQPQLPVAALEALLLLRNLCFHSEAKAHVTANPRALDALVAAAGASDAGARAAAADALLALTHNGQRISALLRKGRRPARLRRFANRASKAIAMGGTGRIRADMHAAKCLNVLVHEVLRVGDVGGRRLCDFVAGFDSVGHQRRGRARWPYRARTQRRARHRARVGALVGGFMWDGFMWGHDRREGVDSRRSLCN
jgi:hypothetical protein